VKRHRRTLAAAGLFLSLNLAVARAFGMAAAPAGPGVAETLVLAAGEGAIQRVGARSLDLGANASTTRELLQSVVPPARDEADLARRFKNTCAAPAAAPVSLSRAEAEGASRPFWVLDEPNRRFFQVQATLRYASEHLLFYVQDGQPGQGVTREALAASAATFEQKTYPVLRQYFGDFPPGARVTIFNGNVPGVGGYFSSSDLLPASVNQYSNERPMVFMNLSGMRPGTSGYDAVLAHELQHFVHSQVHPQQDSWINEGASELAMALAGWEQGGPARTYLNNPETQLNAWADRPSESQAHYGGGYLILEYFAQRLGGYQRVRDLISAPGSSVRTFESFFERERSALHFDDLFRDFVLANLLNDRSISDGRYAHDKVSARARVQETYGAFPTLSNAAVRPYATRYVELTPGAARGALELRFAGSGDTRLYNATPRSGSRQWWGNAVDDMASSMTRELDLAGVESATLRFSTWYSTERDYDYAGVAVSTDGGCSWRTLRGRYTTDSDPTGQNLGHSFTGKSAANGVEGWVDEEMDLTPYAGQRVLVRFFYVTDQSYHGPGFAVDDIAVPEIGFHDDAEADQGWELQGFLRSVNAAEVDWAVQVVAFTDSGPQIQRLSTVRAPEGGAAEGTLVLPDFGASVRRVVVAVSPLVPVTLEPAEYRLQALIR
jgi:immune inhibitor A